MQTYIFPTTYIKTDRGALVSLWSKGQILSKISGLPKGFRKRLYIPKEGRFASPDAPSAPFPIFYSPRSRANSAGREGENPSRTTKYLNIKVASAEVQSAADNEGGRNAITLRPRLGALSGIFIHPLVILASSRTRGTVHSLANFLRYAVMTLWHLELGLTLRRSRTGDAGTTGKASETASAGRGSICRSSYVSERKW